ncbi:hypothetical protein Sdia_24020 [Streptomyces diastaticus subsp. diastaticus]|uniref:DUF2637 domain-containing protein n=1 Tax=Streptomyces diastaticus subsp. diastaticus TaxID=68040 RepID=A0ABQ1CNA8_STRDI|nr:DUF2637 domain-containing protein [Streptomyces diastaticus]GFH71634.1 hypothetical protein Sdia_24020 [Streptomyces diastaticus subsp. diastaticus]GGU13670.1 hypothetical protein GCM10015534_15570 [Streptomyces diastaticus subsp. diastaticus]
MTLATLPLGTRPPRPASDTPPAASDAAPGTSETAPAASDTPRSARRWNLPGGLTRAQTITAAAIVGAALALAGIGLYLSFEHVAVFAHEQLGFATLGKARLFTVGVDVGILVLIALDLLMAWLRRPIGWVRFPVWLLTGATIVLNAASAAPTAGAWTTVDYVAAFAHGIVPVLFIAVVEIGKTAIDRVVREVTPAQGVPLHRWFLSPAPTFALWRRMKLWAVDSYSDAVKLDKERRVYRVMLERQHGSVRKAPSDARLPLTMARYGLSVDEALALPQEAEAREQARLEAEEDARAAEEERRAARASRAEIARLRADGDVQAARADVDAATSRAEVLAGAAVAAAERAATAETEALESEAVARADADRAAAEHRAAEARRRAAEADEAAAEARAREAEAALMEAEDAARTAAAEASTEEDRARAAQARRDAAEADQAAAEARRDAAEAERRAVEAEDEMNLSTRDRKIRRVARMILTEGSGIPESIPLEAVMAACSVAQGTASEYRTAATALLAEGYAPEAR